MTQKSLPFESRLISKHSWILNPSFHQLMVGFDCLSRENKSNWFCYWIRNSISSRSRSLLQMHTISFKRVFRNFDNFLLNEIHHHYALVNGVQKIIHSKQKRNLPILRRSGISKIITTNAEYKNKFIHQRIIFIDHDNLIPIIELDDPKRAWRWSDLNTQINDSDTFFHV
jgi:hypothetical protein